MRLGVGVGIAVGAGMPLNAGLWGGIVIIHSHDAPLDSGGTDSERGREEGEREERGGERGGGGGGGGG